MSFSDGHYILAQYLHWSEIDSLVIELSEKILKSSRTFSSISTVGRGGLIPSRLLADHLEIQTILVDQEKISSKSLFVDDIFDSGITFKKICSKVDDASQLFFATLLARNGKEFPTQLTYAKETESSEYVVFPWDNLEFQKSRNKKRHI